MAQKQESTVAPFDVEKLEQELTGEYRLAFENAVLSWSKYLSAITNSNNSTLQAKVLTPEQIPDQWFLACQINKLDIINLTLHLQMWYLLEPHFAEYTEIEKLVKIFWDKQQAGDISFGVTPEDINELLGSETLTEYQNNISVASASQGSSNVSPIVIKKQQAFWLTPKSKVKN